MINITDLGKSIITLSGKGVSLLKLQKLCYYCQVWYYTLYGEKLVDSPFEALEYGPNSRDIDVAFPVDGTGVLQCDYPDYFLSDPDISRFIRYIFGLYGNLDGNDLSDLTHTEFPWIKARNFSEYDNRPTIIDLEDARSFYAKHPSYRYLYVKLYAELNYLKYIIVKNDNELDITELDKNEKEIIQTITIEKNIIIKRSKDIVFYDGEYKGEMYTFFIIDYNILLLTDEVKEFIMDRMKAGKFAHMEIKEMLEKKEINYFWQYNDENEKKQFFSYTFPALGIMVNEKTLNEAINRAIDMLIHLHDFYNSTECRPQDEQEKEFVNKAYAVYAYSRQDFLTLLGLDQKSQLQGEKIYVEQPV